MEQTFPNTHYVTTVITKKSKITIKSWKTTKDTKATTETQRRTSKIIQNNHSHKYYSGETREHHQQRTQNDLKYLQWLLTCVSIKDENKHQATKTTSLDVQLSGGDLEDSNISWKSTHIRVLSVVYPTTEKQTGVDQL